MGAGMQIGGRVELRVCVCVHVCLGVCVCMHVCAQPDAGNLTVACAHPQLFPSLSLFSLPPCCDPSLIFYCSPSRSPVSHACFTAMFSLSPSFAKMKKHIYVCIYKHICIYVYVHIYEYICIYIYTQIFINTNMYIHVCICLHVYTRHVYMCIHIYMYVDYICT